MGVEWSDLLKVAFHKIKNCNQKCNLGLYQLRDLQQWTVNSIKWVISRVKTDHGWWSSWRESTLTRSRCHWGADPNKCMCWRRTVSSSTSTSCLSPGQPMGLSVAFQWSDPSPEPSNFLQGLQVVSGWHLPAYLCWWLHT